MMRLILLLILAGCSSHQPASLASAMVIPSFRHGCHAPAPEPKVLSPIRTLDQYRAWADATARARDSDKLSLLECTRKVNELVDTLDTIRATLQPDAR